MRLVLASASPRRAELLHAAGIDFDAIPSDADETMHAGEAPGEYVVRVARLKAEAVAVRAPGRPVLGADTIVLAGDEVLGKPADDQEAGRMLRLLSGRTHTVLTGMCLLYPGETSLQQQTGMAHTAVEFKLLSEAEINWYVASGEPRDKAGAYAIQGLASRFVTRIDGSYSNVVGLPVADACRLCAQAGILVS